MSDESSNNSLATRNQHLLSELAELKDRQAILAIEIRSLLEMIRVEGKETSPKKYKLTTKKISHLYLDCRKIDHRCTEIYALMKLPKG